MPTNFPSSIDAFVNPSPLSSLSGVGVSHHLQHTNANDAIEALQAKVGVTGATVIASIDFRLLNASSVNPGHLHSLAALVSLPTDPADLLILPIDPQDILVLPMLLKDGGTGATVATTALDNLGVTLAGAPPSIAASSATGTSTYMFSRADHTHQGVLSVHKSGDTVLFGTVTFTAGTDVTITQVGNNLEISTTAGLAAEDLSAVGFFGMDTGV